MRALNAQQRAEDLATMTREGVDVLIIGGGITGAGIALDAATRGYRVGLVEKSDFASGTSSWSTKLVHGGIRYLPQGDVPLVREALVERGLLLRNAPHLAHPLTFVLPLYSFSRKPVGLPFGPPWGVGLRPILDIGLTLYDALAGRLNVRHHKRIDRAEVLRRATCLRSEGLRSGFLYSDGQTDDTRLTLAVLRSAANAGARLANYAQVTGFEQDANARLSAAHVRLSAPHDPDAERAVTIRARHIINATGVFAEQVEALTGQSPQLHIVPSKGVHLVVSREDLDIGDDAIVLPETEDGRIIFLVPWRSSVIVGTTDTGEGDLDRPIADDTDVDYLLEHLNRSILHPIPRERIVSTYAGYRPLIQFRHSRTPSRLSRTHAIVENEVGLLSISGGKLTTYRRMAQDAMDRIDAREGVKHPCETAQWPLAGADNWPATAPGSRVHGPSPAPARSQSGAAAVVQRGQALSLNAATIAHLGTSYGSLALEVLDLVAAEPTLASPVVPGLPAIMAEVVYSLRNELALTTTDVLERRLRLSLEAADHGRSAAGTVASMLATELGWSNAQRAADLAEYTRYIAMHDGGLQRTPVGAGSVDGRETPE